MQRRYLEMSSGEHRRIRMAQPHLPIYIGRCDGILPICAMAPRAHGILSHNGPRLPLTPHRSVAAVRPLDAEVAFPTGSGQHGAVCGGGKQILYLCCLD